MDPLDFFKTAQELGRLSKESDMRSSVSRTYYGVLHYLCQYIADIAGFDKEKVGIAIHKFVPECFNACLKEQSKYIATELMKLKQRRTDADYKLRLVISNSKCQDSISLAQKIIKINLKAIDAELCCEATKRAKVRGWM